jgi:hypothetical protein
MSRTIDPVLLKALVCAVEQKLRTFTVNCSDENTRASVKPLGAAIQQLRAYVDGDVETLWRQERQRTAALEDEVRRLRSAALWRPVCAEPLWAQPASSAERSAALRALLAAARPSEADSACAAACAAGAGAGGEPPADESYSSPLAAACAAMLRAPPTIVRQTMTEQPTAPQQPAEGTDGDEDLYS